MRFADDLLRLAALIVRITTASELLLSDVVHRRLAVLLNELRTC